VFFCHSLRVSGLRQLIVVQAFTWAIAMRPGFSGCEVTKSRCRAASAAIYAIA
jgi:hypothetical protein